MSELSGARPVQSPFNNRTKERPFVKGDATFGRPNSLALLIRGALDGIAAPRLVMAMHDCDTKTVNLRRTHRHIAGVTTDR